MKRFIRGLKELFHIFYGVFGGCPVFGHRWTAWRDLPSGMRKYRLCLACAIPQAVPPFPEFDRKEVKKALTKAQKKKRLKEGGDERIRSL